MCLKLIFLVIPTGQGIYFEFRFLTHKRCSLTLVKFITAFHNQLLIPPDSRLLPRSIAYLQGPGPPLYTLLPLNVSGAPKFAVCKA